MEKENNDYYEPTIKTTRNDDNGITLKATMPLITKEEMITIDNNLQNIVNEYIQKIVKDKDLALSQYIVKKQNDEKQRLISFLKDLIEETECAYNYKENDYKNSGKWNLLNEILDFVNKGEK